MNRKLRADAEKIVSSAIAAVLPDSAVVRALEKIPLSGKVVLVAAGKAAWQMARAAHDFLGERVGSGIVVTKYGHAREPIPGIVCYEAGHPVPDGNSFRAAEAAVGLVSGLSSEDTVLFLLSGGGSALFEKPLVSAEELQDITSKLLSCGADIVEINTIRKRLSAVKGGRFAQCCAPAHVYSVILSDILGDPLDMIASGPTVPDQSTGLQAEQILHKYGISVSEQTMRLLKAETPKVLENSTACVTGSVRELCGAAAKACEALGYVPHILTDMLCCEAKDAGSFLSSIARTHASDGVKQAYIAGGETVVRVTGSGKGGRNQEIALSAAKGLAGIGNAAVFSVGSDGTDGPTDAAGGYADGDTVKELSRNGLNAEEVLRENDAYHALKCVAGLLFTGPTGTNVNDVSVLLIDGQ